LVFKKLTKIKKFPEKDIQGLVYSKL